MEKTTKLTEQEKALLAQEQQRDRKLLRRRLIGAVVVFLATFLLWEIGGVLPPQQKQTLYPVPPIDTVFPRESAEIFEEGDASGRGREEFGVSEAIEEEVLLTVYTEKAETPVKDVTAAVETVKKEESAVAEEAGEINAEARYVVQIGAFKQLLRAQQLAEDIRQLGFTVRLQPLERDGTQLWRVQVIGFVSRAEAESVRIELKQAGYADIAIKES